MLRWWHTMLRLVRSTVLRTTWIVPRNLICVVFWFGVVIVFVGMILLVTSKHKGSAFLYGGVILLVLGLCIIVACFGLCMHAYFVLATTVDQEDFKSRCEFKKPLQTISINPSEVDVKQGSGKPMVALPPKFKQVLTRPDNTEGFSAITNHSSRAPRLCSQGTIYENEAQLHSMPSESDESVGKIMQTLDTSAARERLPRVSNSTKPLLKLGEAEEKHERVQSLKEKANSKRRLGHGVSSFEDTDAANNTIADHINSPGEINNSKATVYDNVYHL